MLYAGKVEEEYAEYRSLKFVQKCNCVGGFTLGKKKKKESR